jgi:hypothetical protein
VSDFVRWECLKALQHGTYGGHRRWQTTDKAGKVIATEDLAEYYVPFYIVPKNGGPIKMMPYD